MVLNHPSNTPGTNVAIPLAFTFGNQTVWVTEANVIVGSDILPDYSKVKILGNNIADFEYNKLNEKGKEKLNVNFDQANEFKDFCRNNDNG